MNKNELKRQMRLMLVEYTEKLKFEASKTLMCLDNVNTTHEMTLLNTALMELTTVMDVECEMTRMELDRRVDHMEV